MLKDWRDTRLIPSTYLTPKYKSDQVVKHLCHPFPKPNNIKTTNFQTFVSGLREIYISYVLCELAIYHLCMCLILNLSISSILIQYTHTHTQMKAYLLDININTTRRDKHKQMLWQQQNKTTIHTAHTHLHNRSANIYRRQLWSLTRQRINQNCLFLNICFKSLFKWLFKNVWEPIEPNC